MVKEGTLWIDTYGNNFRVLHIVEIDGNTWVHYRTEPPKGHSAKGCKEFSCYIDAFEARFSKQEE
jgi:hypothetical protein